MISMISCNVMSELANYHGSVHWMDDLEADEGGNLPIDLKRSGKSVL